MLLSTVYSGLDAIRMYECMAAFSSCSLIGIRKASISSAGLEVALKASVIMRAALYYIEASFSTLMARYLLWSAVGANYAEHL
jgi:hypothetical protein